MKIIKKKKLNKETKITFKISLTNFIFINHTFKLSRDRSREDEDNLTIFKLCKTK